MNLKKWQNLFNVIVNGSSIVKHVIQNKDGIIKHVNVNANFIASARTIIFGIQVHLFVRIVSI